MMTFQSLGKSKTLFCCEDNFFPLVWLLVTAYFYHHYFVYSITITDNFAMVNVTSLKGREERREVISHTAHMHARWLTSYPVAMTGAPAVKIHEVYHRYYVNSKMFLYDLVTLLNLTSNC